MAEELYNKIDKFCNETDWSKYPTYEHALEDFIKGIVAEETNELEKENAELKEKLNFSTQYYQGEKAKEQLTKAKEIIKILLKYDRGQFFDDRRIYEKYMHTRSEAEQFISEVEK